MYLKIEDRICPLCSEANDFNSVMNLFKCKACGMIFNAKVWNNFANINENKEWFENIYNKRSSFFISRFEKWNNKRTVSRIHDLFPIYKRRKILEIGVGSGSFLQYMYALGFEVTGCDLSEKACETIAEKYHIPMFHGEIYDVGLSSHFDLIVANHILEHVENPVKFLKEVRNKIKTDSFLHLTVPNISSWEARLNGWNGYEPYHLLYFTPLTLKLALEMSGFKVIKMFTHESFSGWFLTILRTFIMMVRGKNEIRKNIRKTKSCSPVEQIYYSAMVLFGMVIFPLRNIQEKSGAGDEIIAIVGPA